MQNSVIYNVNEQELRPFDQNRPETQSKLPKAPAHNAYHLVSGKSPKIAVKVKFLGLKIVNFFS